MYVNRISFVTTFSRNIKFTTVEAIQKRKKAQLVQSIKNVLPIYTQRGLQLDNALLDGEYDSAKNGTFTVHKPNAQLHFVMHQDRLHYLDTKNLEVH